MAQIERIRWLHFQEGWSIRKLARHFRHSQKTIKKYLRQAQIEQWLREDESRPKKQRHTARRIYRRLRDECGYTGSEPTVRRHVARLRHRPAKVFVPLEFAPGESAEADFGEAEVIMAGTRMKVFYFCIRLRCSHMPFVVAFPHQRQEALFEGIRLAPEFFGGVPLLLTFDNLKQAVQKILEGKNRLEQDGFRSLRTHYLFESAFCNPAAGWEKGGVESLVGFARRTFLTPVPDVASFAELNALLRQRCLEYAQRTMRGTFEDNSTRMEAMALIKGMAD